MRFILLFFIVVGFACSSKKESAEESKKTAQDSVTSELPKIPVALIDGRTINTAELKGNTILIFFQPDCSHCQDEAKAIESSFMVFENYHLYFISSADQNEIEKFAVDYKLRGKANVSFGRTEGVHVYNTFGPIEVPSIYIYNENGELVGSFNGETPIDDLKAVL